MKFEYSVAVWSGLFWSWRQFGHDYDYHPLHIMYTIQYSLVMTITLYSLVMTITSPSSPAALAAGPWQEDSWTFYGTIHALKLLRLAERSMKGRQKGKAIKYLMRGGQTYTHTNKSWPFGFWLIRPEQCCKQFITAFLASENEIVWKQSSLPARLCERISRKNASDHALRVACVPPTQPTWFGFGNLKKPTMPGLEEKTKISCQGVVE